MAGRGDITSNRNQLSNVIASVEEISRTVHTIHDILWSLMNNEQEVDHVKSLIEELAMKTGRLRNMPLDAPLTHKENVLVPTMSEASIDTITDEDAYKPPLSRGRQKDFELPKGAKKPKRLNKVNRKRPAKAPTTKKKTIKRFICITSNG